jgi:hypothetical protein
MNAWSGRVGSENALPETMPAVALITNKRRCEELARYVGAGSEEEGIPLSWDVSDGLAADLARRACMSSRLEIGIGVDERGNGAIAMVTVTGAPYIERRADTPEDLRWLGQAAARISKSQPINRERVNVEASAAEISPERTAPTQASSEKLPGDDFESVVSAIVRELTGGMWEGGGGRA